MLAGSTIVILGGGGPFYATIAEMDFGRAAAVLDERLLGSLRVARECAGRVRPGGSLTFFTGTYARRAGPGLTLAAIAAAAVPAITADGGQQLIR
nr:hypothetical protein [uncultured Actinoplanes sp.]